MKDYKKNAALFKAFCDENRLRILETIENGEVCACNVLDQLSISQSTLSHHMKILVDSGIVNARKEGKWVHYSISETGMQEAKDILDSLTSSKGETKSCSCSA